MWQAHVSYKCAGSHLICSTVRHCSLEKKSSHRTWMDGLSSKPFFSLVEFAVSPADLDTKRPLKMNPSASSHARPHSIIEPNITAEERVKRRKKCTLTRRWVTWGWKKVSEIESGHPRIISHASQSFPSVCVYVHVSVCVSFYKAQWNACSTRAENVYR